ncbi:MAG: FAD-binding domain-containing protein [Rivihabitans pingtungensis]
MSIRLLAQLAWAQGDEGAQTWLNELIWREFYQQILWHHPRVAEHAFKPEYDALAFDNDPELFAAWCEGRTGYPIVDAAMRQLAQTGYMHNRLRMIVASFLVKDLLIDWRWGEAHFARLLLDFDLAANNGGWQWAASTGCDAQPYFRIFNPVSQSEKFDAEGKFIRRYVPELTALDNKAIHAPWLAKRLPEDFRLGRDYPKPIVDHAPAPARAGLVWPGLARRKNAAQRPGQRRPQTYKEYGKVTQQRQGVLLAALSAAPRPSAPTPHPPHRPRRAGVGWATGCG